MAQPHRALHDLPSLGQVYFHPWTFMTGSGGTQELPSFSARGAIVPGPDGEPEAIQVIEQRNGELPTDGQGVAELHRGEGWGLCKQAERHFSGGIDRITMHKELIIQPDQDAAFL